MVVAKGFSLGNGIQFAAAKGLSFSGVRKLDPFVPCCCCWRASLLVGA